MVRVRYEFYGSAGDAEMSVVSNKLLLAEQGQGKNILSVSLDKIAILDVSSLRYNKDNKIAIECRPDNYKAFILLKLYLHSLSDVEQFVNLVKEVRPKSIRHQAIPSILHSPFLLRFYHPTIRYGLHMVGEVSGLFIYLGFFFYLTNLVELIPPIDTSNFLPLLQDFTNYCLQNPLYGVLACVGLFIGTPLILPIVIVVFSLFLARQGIHILMSLSLLNDVHAMFKAVRQVQLLIAYVRSGFKIAREKKKEKKAWKSKQQKHED